MRHLLLACAFATLASPASAQTGVLRPVQPPPLTAAEMAHGNCMVADVAAFANRVHVRCGGAIYRSGNDPAGAARELAPDTPNPLDARIVYYAVDLAAQPALAAHALEIGLAARSGSARATIFFRTAASDNPPGCQAGDCRRLTGIVLGR